MSGVKTSIKSLLIKLQKAKSPQIVDVIDFESHAIEILTLILGEEKKAVINRDFDNLEVLQENKNQGLDLLEQVSELKTQWFEQRALKLDRSSLLFQASLFGGEPLEKSAIHNLESIQKLKVQNEINGVLINRGRENNQVLLQLLRGQENQPNLYDSSGQSGAKNSNPLAKA